MIEHPIVKALDPQSILHYYLLGRSIIEPPVTYDLLCGASALAVSLKREVWVDQVHWQVYPALSVLLVGPSGIGKNTAIKGAKEVCQHLDVPIVGGNTIESINDAVAKLGNPASGIITADELADLVGKKDYQQGIVSGLTDLLDTKEVKDISLKSTGTKKIYRPTIGLICGSTAQWLHTGLPKDAQSGGFYGRFIVAAEKHTKRYVGLVKSLPEAEVEAARSAIADFREGCLAVRSFCKGLGEMPITREAALLYDAWYAKRHAIFGPLAADYAHRSRDHCLRLAMLSTLTCLRSEITETDIDFAITFITHIAQSIEVVVAQCSKECEVADIILPMLPAKDSLLLRELARGYSPKLVKDAIAWLRDSGQAAYKQSTGELVLVDPETGEEKRKH